MSITTRQLIAFKSIPLCGNKSIKSISEISGNNQISSTEELVELFNYCIDKKTITRINQKITFSQLEYYLRIADNIIEKSEEQGIHAVTFQDKNYPKSLLKTINEHGNLDIPTILYYKGDLNICNLPCIAIIGTREPTDGGLKAGMYLGELLADAGYNVVSGLAKGCDTAGHMGTLKTKDGKTTAFLAHGLDSIYPAENKKLAEEIVSRGGLLMSEYPIGTTVNRYNLVARDRLQAALADATIVIQSGIKGGTMHAVTNTILAGKPLFCVKYKNQDDCLQAKGNEYLVNTGMQIRINTKDGIKLVYAKADYISSFNALDMVKDKLK